MNKPPDNFTFAKEVKEASEQSPLIWALSYITLPKGGKWSFSDRRWQIEILEDLHPSIVVMKPTQVGLTTIMTAKVLWFITFIKSRAMVTFPRRDDVYDYVAATIDPIVEASELLYTKLGKPNTVRMKRFGDSYFHIMEASVTPRMLPVDILANDEVDLSDPDNLEQFLARLDMSKYKYHYRFSTPTVAGYGIDAEYERSDQREWVVECEYCDREQVLDWEIHFALVEGTPMYLCEACKEKLSVESIVNGKWVAMNPESLIHGYHVSHMMLPILRPPEKLFQESLVMDQKTFYNLRLGRPWRPIGGSMPPTLFRDNSFIRGHERMEWSDDERYFAGIDQANDAHIVIGRQTHEGGLDIVYAEHIKPEGHGDHFDRLGMLLKLFNIRYGIIDANPNRVSAYKLCNEFHGKLSACDIGALNYPFRYHGFSGDSAYKVNVNRTDLLDGLRDMVSDGSLQIWGQWNNRLPVVDQMISHCGALKRDTAKRKLASGGEKIVGVWRKTGHDHFAFALGLLRLAAIIDPGASSFRATTIGSKERTSAKKRVKMKKSTVWSGLEYPVNE